MSGKLDAELEKRNPIPVSEARSYNDQSFAQALHRFAPFPATGQVFQELQGNRLPRSGGMEPLESLVHYPMGVCQPDRSLTFVERSSIQHVFEGVFPNDGAIRILVQFRPRDALVISDECLANILEF